MKKHDQERKTVSRAGLTVSGCAGCAITFTDYSTTMHAPTQAPRRRKKR